jgi:hypothetical protein
MSLQDFVLTALGQAGITCKEEKPGVYVMNQLHHQNRFVFNENENLGVISPMIVFAPGRPDFEKLVSKHAKENECFIQGINAAIRDEAWRACGSWVVSFGGSFESARDTAVADRFFGTAVLRVRVSMAHDSYEKLIELFCPTGEGVTRTLAREPSNISPQSLGIDLDALAAEAAKDRDIVEFCRYYIERLSEELRSVRGDERREKKLSEDFTPRLQMDLVGLKGAVKRKIHFETHFRLRASPMYTCDLSVDNESGDVLTAPPMEVYDETGAVAPSTCFNACAVSGKRTLRHLLIRSEESAKLALPEHIVQCSLSGKLALSTEVAVSDLTGKPVLISAMKTSAVSGKRGEPAFFGQCNFTRTDVLSSELEVSQVSGKFYRNDEVAVSAVSLTRGHKTEFIECPYTGKILLADEAECCDMTGNLVAPGTLKQCEITNKRVVPWILGECAITHKTALLDLLVVGSISNATMLKTKAVMSSRGNYCHPSEALTCTWDRKTYHPEDMGQCSLSGLPVMINYLFGQKPALNALVALLNKPVSEPDASKDTAPALVALTSVLGAGNYTVTGAIKRPASDLIVIAVDSKKMFGLVRRRHGFVYSTNEGEILGQVATGKWNRGSWVRIM